MKAREIIITILITILVCVLFALNFFANKFVLHAESIYKVYLDGNIVGYITDDQELYSIINSRQKEIKNKYNVKKVYPPENFEIVKTNSYNVTVSSAEEIYNKVAQLEAFTIEGYAINIKTEDDINTFYILDKDIFDKAIHNFISAFISDDEFNAYINDSQPEIETTGKIIEKMYFDETITIKQGYIDVNEKIYTNETELSQYLLFGEDAKIEHYKVQEGDTIDSISEANKLNAQEFLIANPEYTSKDSLLKIGNKVNVTLIDPIITLSYEVNEVSDAEIAYEKKTVYDASKPVGYSEITTPGVTGITRINSQYIVKNGEVQSGVYIDSKNSVVITEKVDEVTTRGGSSYIGNSGSGSYVDTGDEWGWPTNYPYVITSGFEYRWGTFHDGIDISGTGYGSPIYASLDGEVIAAGNGGMLTWVAGYNVVIRHDNGYYTVYAHMVPGSILVSVGNHVSRGQRIGSMGQSGVATGPHLHFGLWYGVPYGGGRSINPLSLWPRR